MSKVFVKGEKVVVFAPDSWYTAMIFDPEPVVHAEAVRVAVLRFEPNGSHDRTRPYLEEARFVFKEDEAERRLVRMFRKMGNHFGVQ